MSDTPAAGASSNRTIVLCLDGTWNEFDGDNTNVVRFFSLLKKDNFDQQMCYYQPGIGTFFAPGVVSPVFEFVAKVADAAVAWYLDAHVMDAYRFIMQNYRQGDKICLFGFSRGAYTARALAGMLYKVGLLPRDNQEQIAFAYKLYTREDEEGITLAAGFKRAFCHNVQVEFMGVWETVDSVGLIATKTLPFTNSNRSIKTFRHAIALDERRANFKPNLFHRSPPESASSRTTSKARAALKWLNPFKRSCVPDPDATNEDAIWAETDIIEVWFVGCHLDVGGGYVKNDVKHSLSNITLRWMVQQVVDSQCGIMFNDESDSFKALDLRSISSIHIHNGKIDAASSPVPENTDAIDALEPIHDEIKAMPLWWILELIPRTFLWQGADGRWNKRFAWNLGRGRTIVENNPKLHVTVRERMKELGYVPAARWEHDPVYVE